MTKRNYTLIELLTVIFIIAVLAGLIMPATALVRAKARRTECSSNLKQVGALCMQFSNDRDGQLPLYKAGSAYTVRSKNIENYLRKQGQRRFEEPKSGTSAVASGNRVYWTAGLLRYAKYNMNVFFCPSDDREVDVFSGGNASYSLNYGDADRPGGAADASAFVKMTQVTRSPGGVILVGETDRGQLGMNSTGSFNTFFWVDNGDAKKRRKPHSSEYNTSFLDGHVETLPFAELNNRYDKDGYKIK